jgi:hypothetical protein
MSLNTIAELLEHTQFRQGSGTGVDSVREGNFTLLSFQNALDDAYADIQERLMGRDITSLPTYRQHRIKRAEVYLALAYLYEQFGERIGIVYPESNIQGVGGISVGADTPPPVGLNSKGEYYGKTLPTWARERATELLRGFKWKFSKFSLGYDSTEWPYECSYLGLCDANN